MIGFNWSQTFELIKTAQAVIWFCDSILDTNQKQQMDDLVQHQQL